MQFMIPMALFSWVPFTILLFFKLKPHHAVLVSVIGGTLLLPMAGYNLPGIPPFTKSTAISLGLVLGGRISGKRQVARFRWQVIDLPMLFWCLIPLATSLSNNLGWYDGFSGIWNAFFTWGALYFSGRIYFDSTEKLQELCRAIVIGGLIYLPLCLYEIRMSPQLSNMIYGFFPQDFIEHRRYGGFRPLVFMQHGLMVALWMATTTTAAFWLWRSGAIRALNKIPMSLLVPFLILTTLLCKSANGWFALILGCGSYLLYRCVKSVRPFQILLLVIPVYMVLRITGAVEGTTITDFTSHLVDAERVESLSIRLGQEDLFIEKMWKRPLLGWGGFSRGWPTDPETGKRVRTAIDALWLITVSGHGILGITLLVTGMLIGPWRSLRLLRTATPSVRFSYIAPLLLCLIVLLFLIDSLVNGMVNGVYIIISGALVGWQVAVRQNMSTIPSCDHD
jgi:hypothetical protein